MTDSVKVPIRQVSSTPSRALRRHLAVVFPIAVLFASSAARATERHLNTTYESGVLDHSRAEPWTTWRYGVSDFCNAFDERIEFELGLVGKPGSRLDLTTWERPGARVLFGSDT